jgi:hypothetical protein
LSFAFDILRYLQQAWSLFLLFGSLSGWVAVLSLGYQWRFNRLDLKIDLERVRVERGDEDRQGGIEVCVRMRNRSARRDTSIEAIDLAIMTKGEGFLPEMFGWLVDAFSVKEKRGQNLEEVNQNIKIEANTTRNFEIQFHRPRAGRSLPLRIEGRWRKHRPLKLVVDTTHRTYTTPVGFLSIESVGHWFMELWMESSSSFLHA